MNKSGDVVQHLPFGRKKRGCKISQMISQLETSIQFEDFPARHLLCHLVNLLTLDLTRYKKKKKKKLVGGLNPSEKCQSVGISIPNIWENKKCSKPPTRPSWKSFCHHLQRIEGSEIVIIYPEHHPYLSDKKNGLYLSITLWMEEILNQLIGGLSHYLQSFNHPAGAGLLPSTVSS